MIATSLRAFALFAGIGLFGCANDTPARAAQPVDGSIAVVELFTSEGCSSCPPADALLSRIMHDADKDGRAIFPIAWHVDYWDRLGWRDPFSSAEASGRQTAYADAFHTTDIYTPQMIVNGKAGFVGSNEDQAAKEIAAALSKPAAAHVVLQAHTAGDHLIAVSFKADDAPAGAVLVVAAVERELSVHVARGENGGRTLVHDNVVRSFQQRSLDQTKSGDLTLSLPAGVNVKNVRVIAFIQALPSMQILGASTVKP